MIASAFCGGMSYYSSTGIFTDLETELSIITAEKFLSLLTTAEQVRYTNTGTEAILYAMMTARVYTGKPPVAVIEGAYNGCHDAVFVSTWPDLTKAGDTKVHQNHSQAPLEVFFI